MATARSLWGGIIAAVVGIVFSIVLLFTFGLMGEKTVSTLESTDISEDGTIYDIPAPWNTGYNDSTFWMSVLYIILISPAILGLVIMFVSAIKTQEYDVFEDNEEGYGGNYGGQAVPQYITPEEIAFRRSQ